jgi:pimeloyl-ACP methyl ester carboxylesterase
MTFGYDADVVRFWTITSSNRLDDHGKSLAYAVLDQRAKVGQRPIVFVAHSLGGLVCEEALNLSTKRQDLADILPNTLGIIFMGTPHGGSHLANWGSTVAKYVNVFRGTNREILGNLQPGSSDLLRTEEDFQHTLRRDDVKLMIYCFYEALKMNDIIGKVVEREAAILHGYDNCSINADHRTMTKFTGRADAGYGQVRGVLERWTRKHETRCSDARETTRVLMTGNSDRAEPSTNGPSSDGPSPSGPSHNGPVFSGPISGHYVIPGTYTTGGTVNFNVAG